MSHVERLLGDATERAAAKGHRLGWNAGGWRFKYQQASAICVNDGCGCAVLVTLVTPHAMQGGALALSCKAGNAHLFPPPQQPVQPSGRAKRRPIPVAAKLPDPVPA